AWSDSYQRVIAVDTDFEALERVAGARPEVTEAVDGLEQRAVRAAENAVVARIVKITEAHVEVDGPVRAAVQVGVKGTVMVEHEPSQHRETPPEAKAPGFPGPEPRRAGPPPGPCSPHRGAPTAGGGGPPCPFSGSPAAAVSSLIKSRHSGLALRW